VNGTYKDNYTTITVPPAAQFGVCKDCGCVVWDCTKHDQRCAGRAQTPIED